MYDAPDAAVKQPVAEKVEAIKDTLKYFKMINQEIRGG